MSSDHPTALGGPVPATTSGGDLDWQSFSGGPAGAPVPSGSDDEIPYEERHDLELVPFEETPIGKVYQRRVDHGQDIVIIVTDHQNRRGTGKTTLSLKLADRMDRTDEGLTPEKVAINPEEIIDAYTSMPNGSALVLDEAEAGIASRDAMTSINKAMQKIVSMGRVEEKYLVLNAPDSEAIDKSIKKLSDFWLLVEALGRARGYRFMKNPFSGQILTKGVQEIEWSDLEYRSDLWKTFHTVTREKRSHLRGESENYIPVKEHQKRLRKETKSAKTDVRDAVIRAFAKNTDLKYTEISRTFRTTDIDVLDITPRRIGQIVRGE